MTERTARIEEDTGAALPSRRGTRLRSRHRRVFLTVLLVTAVAGAGSGCVARKVQYNLKGVTKFSASPWQDYSMSVAEIRDSRGPNPPATHEPLSPALVREDPDNDGYYINSADHYDEPVPVGVKHMLVEHLRASGLFRGMTDDPRGADLVLTGTLRRLRARVAKHATAEFFAQQGGILTMPIAWAHKAKFDADASLLDLQLARAGSGEVLWRGAAVAHLTGERSVGKSPWIVYDHANDALRAAIENLVANLSRSVPGQLSVEAPPADDPDADEKPFLADTSDASGATGVEPAPAN